MSDDYPLIRRPVFFEGRVLTADDLRTEQEYHRNLRYLHNRTFLGSGIADGLELSSEGLTVTVSPGFAIDRFGREIVLREAASLDLSTIPVEAGTKWAVAIAYGEEGSGPVPCPSPDDDDCHAFIDELPRLELVRTGGVTPDAIDLGEVIRGEHEAKVRRGNRQPLRRR